MRVNVSSVTFALTILLITPIASAEVYEEILPSSGWDVWTVESFGGRMSATSFATDNGPALTGVSILDDTGRLLGRAFGFASGGGYGAQAKLPAAGVTQTIDANGGESDFFLGAGVSIDTALTRVHVVAWSAGDDIHRKIRISTLAGSTPTLTLRARSNEAFYFTSADTSTGVAAEAQVLPVEADASVGASRSFHTDGTFFGLVGRGNINGPRPVSITLPNGTTQTCPCEFMRPSDAPDAGDFRVDWQGVNVDLASPVLGGADVLLPKPLAGP